MSKQVNFDFSNFCINTGNGPFSEARPVDIDVLATRILLGMGQDFGEFLNPALITTNTRPIKVRTWTPDGVGSEESGLCYNTEMDVLITTLQGKILLLHLTMVNVRTDTISMESGIACQVESLFDSALQPDNESASK